MKRIKLLVTSIVLSLGLIIPTQVFASNVNVNVTRLAGQDRYETNSKIVDNGWSKADSVILCNSTMYADAIVCSPLSKKLDAPILLTDGNTLSETAKDKIQSLGAKNVYIIGGTGVISTSIEDNLKSQGLNTTRIAGANRYETSLEVAKYLPNPSTVYFTDGENWQDALSISPVAAKLQAPIILGSRTESSSKIKDYMEQNEKAKVIALNDNNFLSSKGVSDDLIGCLPINASNSLDMNEKIAEQYKNDLDFSNVYLASETIFADALSGSALASKNDNPIILVNKDNRQNSYDIINNSKNNIKTVSILGGDSVIGDDGISMIFDVTGLESSIDKQPSTQPNNTPTPTPTIPTQSTDNTASNIINSATIQDYYSLLHEDGNGSFTNFADTGLALAVQNNDIVKSVNSGMALASNNNVYGFLKLIGNSNNIKSMTYFFKEALPGAKSISTNVDSHKGLIIVRYSTNQKLMGDAVIAIEYNKDVNKFELYIQNFAFLPINVQNALKQNGFSIISNDNSQVYQDCTDMDSFNLNSTKINQFTIVRMLQQNSNTFMYTGFNEKDTSYGKYINGLYVLNATLNSYIVFISSSTI